MHLSNELIDLVSDLESILDPLECGDRLVALYTNMGAHAVNIWVDYGYGGKVAGNYPEEWRKHIYEMGWGEKHHICEHSKKSMKPIAWGMDITPTDPLSNIYGIKVVETAYDAFGAKSAVTFPVHSFSGEQSGGISFVTDLNHKEFESLMKDILPLAQSAAILTHQRIQLLSKYNDSFAPPPLAPREKECVQWLANGRRTHQIAQRMGIKDVTVNLYIQNAKKKLRARTREQLIALSVTNGHVSI